MEGQRKSHLSEGIPLNSTGAANIFLNPGMNVKKTPDSTAIHLQTGTSDVGVHINTTFSIASSKKIKLLFVLNFLLSLICIIISCSIAFYYWNEMITMRKQIDMIKDQFITQTRDRPEPSSLVAPRPKSSVAREPRTEMSDDKTLHSPKKYYVEELGEDMLLVDSKKKSPSLNTLPAFQTASQKDLLVVHFNGARGEANNLGSQSIVGPWVLDTATSSRGSEASVALSGGADFVTIRETGLYLVYAQLVYQSHAPSYYSVFARQQGQGPRLLATCATGDDASSRPLDKAQMSCSVQTVARLTQGDVVNIAQREKNRTLWLQPGYSYFGFIKLGP